MKLALPMAQTRRQIGARRYDGIGASCTTKPARPIRRPRGVFGVALAVLRQPRHKSANMESPTIHAALVENSLTDIQLVSVAGSDPRTGSPVKNSRLAIVAAAIGLLGVAAIAVAAFIPTSAFSSIKRPYALVPASAEEVGRRLQFGDAQRYEANGEFLFVTIRQPELSALSWLMFRREKTIAPGTYVEIFGERTPAQNNKAGQVQMVSAKQAAEYVALNKLGFPIDLVPGEIIIDYIVCLKNNADNTKCAAFAPSGKVLEEGDKLLKLDGKAIETINDIAPILKGRKPGEMLSVEYERAGEAVKTAMIEVTAAPDDKARTIVGFAPVDTTQVGKEPFPVTFNTDGINGPSAGLAFTLTLIDELTPGELTGGQRIAVTGTINIDGQVGAIGGLPQKASAVYQTGTKYFLVPASQNEIDLKLARANAPGVQIIPVATLDEALAQLAKLGGNSAELGMPGKDFVPSS
jgi:Lon-like protease